MPETHISKLLQNMTRLLNKQWLPPSLSFLKPKHNVDSSPHPLSLTPYQQGPFLQTPKALANDQPKETYLSQHLGLKKSTDEKGGNRKSQYISTIKVSLDIAKQDIDLD